MNETERIISEKMAERKELFLRLSELDKQFESAKLKRCLLTIAFYTVVNMAIAYAILDVFGNGADFKGILASLLPSLFIAGVSFVVNLTIFFQLFNKSDSENVIISSMEKRLTEIDRELGKLRESNYQNNK